MTNLLLDLKIKNPAKQILSGKTFTYYVCLTPSLSTKITFVTTAIKCVKRVTKCVIKHVYVM